MAKSKELFGLIVGFAAGTFLGAMFMAIDRCKAKKKKEKDKESDEVVG